MRKNRIILVSLIMIAMLGLGIPRVFAMQPSVSFTAPINGATNVPINVSVTAQIIIPNGGVDDTTLNNNTVFLYPTALGPGAKVAVSSLNSTGGGDAITLTPLNLLATNTNYTFQITAGLQDISGQPFIPYTMSFTTGTSGGPPATTINFTKVTQAAVPNSGYTQLLVGPDRKLYASTYLGQIMTWDIQADGTLVNPIEAFRYNPLGSRIIIGMAFEPGSTAANPVLWITHNDGNLATSNKHFTGAVARLSKVGGVWTPQEKISGLPRSVRDHLTNSLVFGPDGAIYIPQGSISAQGAPDTAWGNEPETLFSGAVLRIDINKLNALSTLPLNATTGIPNVTGDLLNQPNYGLGDPQLVNFYDPLAPNAPLTLYATGIRNVYDLLWHTNGRLYAPGNSSAAGGNAPGTPVTLPISCQFRIDRFFYGAYTGPAIPAVNTINVQPDYLYRIEQGGYYGHPNPTRCEWVLNGGNPTAGVDPFEIITQTIGPTTYNGYPVGTQPDRNYRAPIYNFQFNKSPNGVIEYRSNTFGGALRGRILVTRFSQKDDILVLEVDGTGGISNEIEGIPGFTGFADPLDLIEDTTNGNIYVATLPQTNPGAGSIILLRPTIPGTPEITVTPSSLIFGDVVGGGTSAPQSFTITNTGNADLDVSQVIISGVDAAQFAFSGAPGAPFTLAPGASRVIGVVFGATSTGQKTAVVQIQNTDVNNSTATVQLSGLGAPGTGGNNEPSLQAIVNAWNIQTNIGDNNPANTTIHDTTPTAPLLGEEVSLQLMQKAGSGPVTIQVLGAYGLDFNPVVEFGWVPPGTPNAKTKLFTVNQGSHQTLTPAITGTTVFDPGDAPFGFYTWWLHPTFGGNRQVFTENALNTFQPSQLHHARLYPYKPNGVLVPNAYVLGFEEFTSGWDFNDIVVVVHNVRPPLPAAPGGTVDFTNLDWTGLAPESISGLSYLNRWLSFSRINSHVGCNSQCVNLRDHNRVTLRIHNRHTTNTLQINSIISSDTTEFWLPNGENTFTIAPGGFQDVVVEFRENTGSKGVRRQTLTINSSDPVNPISTIELAGVYMVEAEGGDELDMDQLATAFGITTNIGLTGTGQWVPQGEEVMVFDWRRLNPALPMHARQLGAYHQCCTTTANFRFDFNVDADVAMSHHAFDSQSLLPLRSNNTTPAQINASSNDIFHFLIDGRTPCSAACGNNHAIRTYPWRNPQGNIVPGAYLVIFDYTATGFTNFDYQDNFYLVTNIQPNTATVDLQVSMTDSPDPVTVGANLTYNISVLNNAPFPADNTTVTVTLPASVTLINALPSQGICTGTVPTLTCTLNTLGSSQTATIQVVVSPTVEVPLTASAAATTTSTETNVANNNATTTTSVLTTNPGNVIIIKDADVDGPDTFNFTGGFGNFTLIDNGAPPTVTNTWSYNFQPDASPVPAGFVKDIGSPYSAIPKANGQIYGWFIAGGTPANNNTTRDRNAAGVPQELDTFIHMQQGGSFYWEHNVTNGTYRVTVSVGDPSFTDSLHTIRVESLTAINNYNPAAPGAPKFAQATVTVDVSDGRLTIDAVGGTNTKLNYVIIEQISQPNRRGFSNLTPGVYNVTEIVPPGWTLQSITCIGGTSTPIANGVSLNVLAGSQITCTFANSSSGVAPTAVNDSFVVPIGGPAGSFNILANDLPATNPIDPASVDLDPNTPAKDVTVTIAQGTFTYAVATGVTFTPTGAYNGPVSIEYTVDDTAALVSNRATITVTPPNTPPVPAPDSAVTQQNIPVTFNIITNDIDPEGNLDPASVDMDTSSPTIETTINVANVGTFAYNAGSVTFTPDAAFTGSATVPYTVADTLGARSGPVNITVTVTGVCSPYSPNPCTTIPVSIIPNYCMTWDTGPVGGLSGTGFTMVDPPSNNQFPAVPSNPLVPGYEPSLISIGGGHLIINSTQGIQYLNNTNTQVNALGVGFNAATAPFTITTTVVNPPFPDANNAQQAGIWFGLDEDNYVKLVVANRTGAGLGTIEMRVEVAGGSVNAQQVNVASVNTSTITLNMTVDPTTNQVTGTFSMAGGSTQSGSVGPFPIPASFVAGQLLPDGSGPVSFGGLFTTNRNSSTSLQFHFGDFCINSTAPNTAPVANDDIAQTLENVPVTVNVILNDTDAEFNLNPAAVTVTTAPTNGAAAANPDGTITYTPNAGFFGVDTLTYQVCDLGGLCDTAVLTITVLDAPDAVDDTYSTNIATPLVVPAPGVLVNDVDSDDTTFFVVLIAAPANGSVIGLANDGSFTYVPLPAFTGTDTFTYRVCDDDGGCDTAVVTINVAVGNRPPVPVDDNANTPQGTPVIIDVAVNDTDPDGNLNPASAASTSTPANGAVVNNANGTITYTPNAGFFGIDTFTYQICDTDTVCANANVSVTVATTGPAISIAILPAAQTVVNGGAANYNITVANVGTIDLNNVIVITSTPAGGTTTCNNTIANLPALAGAGSTVTYACTDTNVDPAYVLKTASVSGTPTNGDPDVTGNAQAAIVVVNAPVAVDDTATTIVDVAVTVDVLANDTDADGNIDPASVTITAVPANGTALPNAGGTITYTPVLGFIGTDTFDYQVCDTTTQCDTATVTVTITNGNVPPNAVADAVTTPENLAVTINAVANDTDPNGNLDPTTTADLTAPANGVLVNNNDGTFLYTPNTGFFGTDTFDYEVCDTDGLCATATVTITVTEFNDPPVAADDTATTTEDTPVVIDVLVNDTDPENDPLNTDGIIVTPANGAVSLNPDGTLTYSPNPDFSGVDTFVYQVCDPGPACDTAVVTVTVTAQPDGPTANNDNSNTPLDTPVTVNVQGNDVDPDGDVLTTTNITVPAANGAAVINGNGTITYTPNTGFTGIDTFDYEVCDPSPLCDTATVSINVGVANNPPIAVDDSGNTRVGKPVTVTVLANDTDPDGDTILNNGITTLPTNGIAVVNPGGTVTYTPNAGFAGTDTFSYEVCDPALLCATAVVTINVSATVFDPPSSVKVVTQQGQVQLEWSFFWLNPNTVPLLVRVTDPIPAGLPLVPNSLSCVVRGADTVTNSCSIVGNEAVWEGTLGPAPGFTVLAGAPNAVVISFRTNIPEGVNSAQNQARLEFDGNNDGTLDSTATSNVAAWSRAASPDPTPVPGGQGGDPEAQGVGQLGSGGQFIDINVTPGVATPGEPLTFTITITNNGATLLNAISVDNLLPDDFIVISANASGGSAIVGGQLVTFTIDALLPGESITITVQTVVRQTPASYINVVTACMIDASGARVCDSVQVLGVTTLPKTGESPWSAWRPLIILLGGLVVMIVVAIAARAAWRRNRF